MGKIQEILDSRQCPGILGTRDSFGIKREFYDPKTGKYITNFNEWERAGFKEIDTIGNDKVKKLAKQKEKKCRLRGDRQIDPRNLPE